jgi:hypothetical protein
VISNNERSGPPPKPPTVAEGVRHPMPHHPHLDRPTSVPLEATPIGNTPHIASEPTPSMRIHCGLPTANGQLCTSHTSIADVPRGRHPTPKTPRLSSPSGRQHDRAKQNGQIHHDSPDKMGFLGRNRCPCSRGTYRDLHGVSGGVRTFLDW